MSGTPAAIPACCGACDQGRHACTTQQACQISIAPDAPRPGRRRGDGLRIVAAWLCGAALAAAVLGSIALTLYAMGVTP